jgi:hypothetical protein
MLEGMTPPVRVFPCRVRTLTTEFDESDARIFTEALSDHDAWSNHQLSAALTKRGVPISEKAIRKHRSGLCSCR